MNYKEEENGAKLKKGQGRNSLGLFMWGMVLR